MPWRRAIGMGSGPSHRGRQVHRSPEGDRRQHRGRSTPGTALPTPRACHPLRAGRLSCRPSPSASLVRSSSSPRADAPGRYGSPPVVGCNRSHRPRGPRVAGTPWPRPRSHGRPRDRHLPSAPGQGNPPPHRARVGRLRRRGRTPARRMLPSARGRRSSAPGRLDTGQRRWATAGTRLRQPRS